MRYRILAFLLLFAFAPTIAAGQDSDATATGDTKGEEGKEGDAKPGGPDEKPEIVAFAVIVNEKNPVTKVTFAELRSYLHMRRQFWPNRKRCDLFLPKRDSAAYAMLLDVVYKTSDKKLQKYWVRLLFSGEIPAKPSVVTSAAAAVAQVKKSEGALSIIPADEVPKGVQTLLIDGKKPGDKDYPLVGKKSAKVTEESSE